MSTEIVAKLDFDNCPIRMVGTAERPEWVAADVCRILGISEPANVMRGFTPTEKGMYTIHIPQAGTQDVLTVTEPGLYRLIFKSRKPEAERFRVWVTHEVLPSLRQHGCYPPPLAEVQSRAIVSVDAGQFTRELGITLRDAIDGIGKRFESRCDRIEEKVEDVANRLARIEVRKAIPIKTQRNHLYIVAQYYSGNCPCCRSVLIVNSARVQLASCQFDHWFKRSEVDIGKTWAICGDCNNKLNDPDFKHSRAAQFEAYQDCRRQYERALKPQLPFGEEVI